MIAGTFYLMFLFAGLRYRTTAFFTVLIVIVYTALAGAGIPVQRAACGSALVLFAVLLGRPANLLNALCFAFFLLLLSNPKSLWNIGFQLSFLSVFSLVLLLPLLARLNAWALPLGSSLAVLLGTFPAVLYYFNIFSPVSILANLVAIPVFDAALFSALIALITSAVPFLNILPVWFSSLILRAGLAWIRHLSTWRWGYVFLARPSFEQLAAYYGAAAVILFLHRRSFRGKSPAMAAAICAWFAVSLTLFTGGEGRSFELKVLASGKNQIAYARFSNGARWLLNSGRSFPSDQGEWLIAPFLRFHGVQRLEGILLTGLSKKQIGGLESVLRDFPVRFLLYPAAAEYGSKEFREGISKLGRKARTVRPGDGVRMGDEWVRMIAGTEKGAAFLIESGPWRFLVISRWDAALFKELLRVRAGTDEVHAVFFPEAGRGIPGEFQDWLDRARPLLAVSPERQEALVPFLVAVRVPYLDLKRTGALGFKRNGPRLEITSFRNGPLGVYSYL